MKGNIFISINEAEDWTILNVVCGVGLMSFNLAHAGLRGSWQKAS